MKELHKLGPEMEKEMAKEMATDLTN